MTINFQRLLDVVKATEELPLGGFNMSTVCRDELCGTVGCMIGNYNRFAGRGFYRFGASADSYYFGITRNEYDWLFDAGLDEFHLDTEWANCSEHNMSNITRQAALSRLRKFIYYKMHKHEMCHDEKYGVRQEARTKEGNHGFSRRALEESNQFPGVRKKVGVSSDR